MEVWPSTHRSAESEGVWPSLAISFPLSTSTLTQGLEPSIYICVIGDTCWFKCTKICPSWQFSPCRVSWYDQMLLLPVSLNSCLNKGMTWGGLSSLGHRTKLASDSIWKMFTLIFLLWCYHMALFHGSPVP